MVQAYFFVAGIKRMPSLDGFAMRMPLLEIVERVQARHIDLSLRCMGLP